MGSDSTVEIFLNKETKKLHIYLMNKSPFMHKQTRQVLTMAMWEYLQYLGQRIAI